MSGLWKEMRPYLALWRPVVRLSVGSWRLLGKVTALCLAGEGSDKLWRALGLLLAAEFGRRVADRAPLVMVPVTFAWLWFAWKAGPAAKTEPTPDGDQEQQETEPEAPLPDREQLAHALHQVAAPHAHLAVLATHLDCPPARVREALTEAGIPVAAGVRVGGRVSTGVRAGDIPPLPNHSPDAPDGRCSAGQASNNNSNNLIVERPYPGMLIVRDRAEHAARHHTVQRP